MAPPASYTRGVPPVLNFRLIAAKTIARVLASVLAKWTDFYEEFSLTVFQIQRRFESKLDQLELYPHPFAASIF